MPPPNTPEEGVVANAANTTTLALRPLVRAEQLATTVAAAVDLRALEYETTPDENLVCPICRVALVSPVITNCDHVFCQKCLGQAHTLNPVCPVDRTPLKLDSHTRPAPKIVHNQLDNLMVRCPNRPRGCDLVVARSLVENHVTRYCDKTLVACPHPSCDKTVARKDAGKGCLHYDVQCEYCQQATLKADLEEHQDKQCPNRTTNCDLCSAEFVRVKHDEHVRTCPDVETACRFAAFGCARQMRRKFLDAHCEDCEYRVVGPVGGQLAELRTEMDALQEKDRLKDRRIKFLENRGFTGGSATTPGESAIADMSLAAGAAAPGGTSADPTATAPYESRDQYFLSLFETMESKVERLSSALTEVEGRHSMMLFNETLQIKDQLTEIRSTLGVLGMHVRWLMNFRLQERGRVATGGPAMPGGFGAGGAGAAGPGGNDDHGEMGFGRRLSDPARENRPQL